ncbi:hypothetical protein N665_0399s0031 [Sinapis alba]|nr:hypothetical protein N665_0399s0031 [Sinapis alba]
MSPPWSEEINGFHREKNLTPPVIAVTSPFSPDCLKGKCVESLGNHLYHQHHLQEQKKTVCKSASQCPLDLYVFTGYLNESPLFLITIVKFRACGVQFQVFESAS